MSSEVKPIKMSVCVYNDKTFEVLIKRGEVEVNLTGKRKQALTEEQMILLDELAPACVWTEVVPKPDLHKCKRVKELKFVAEALLEYIDAIPSVMANAFPTMPGINRDYVEEVLNKK